MSNQHDAASPHDDSELFEWIPNGLALLNDSEVKQKLLQWNLDRSLRVCRFRVKRSISSDKEDELLHDFFADPSVRSRLHLPAKSGSSAVQLRRLCASATSLAFFDKLEGAGVVAASGALRRCLDEVHDGATASDLLKEAFINPDSDNAELFTESEQSELILHLFRALVIGGSMCQSDEHLEPYLDMTRRFYKALVSVKKNAMDPSTIDVTSKVFAVDAADPAVFTSDSRFNSCFAIVDAKKRWVTVWHHTFEPFW
ncbi:hypothetical protein ATCC90586_004815 [Pythium insidiosum]|nr:hypothetical protein ATCC90586_004815 [Pythium insidiosum]